MSGAEKKGTLAVPVTLSLTVGVAAGAVEGPVDAAACEVDWIDVSELACRRSSRSGAGAATCNGD